MDLVDADGAVVAFRRLTISATTSNAAGISTRSPIADSCFQGKLPSLAKRLFDFERSDARPSDLRPKDARATPPDLAQANAPNPKADRCVVTEIKSFKRAGFQRHP